MTPRRLTDGEIELARSIFGDSIDYARVTVTDDKYVFFQPKGVAMTPNGSLYMNGCYYADYAAESSYTRGFFIHEMTHVWQFQNKVLNPVAAAAELNLKHKFNYEAAYDFHLDEKKDLTQYNMEQQASIVEEYFLVRHAGMASHACHCKNSCSDNERLQLYEKVLAQFLKNPAYARQSEFPKPFIGKHPKP